MKSVKPGRGQSKVGAIGAVFASIFGVFWCIIAASIGAYFMIPFGLIFVGFSVCMAIYNARNVKAKDRNSIIDIVDSEEESDPLNEKYGRNYAKSNFGNEGRVGNSAKKSNEGAEENKPGTSVTFCPYCGKSVDGDFDFCPNCGKKLPD